MELNYLALMCSLLIALRNVAEAQQCNAHAPEFDECRQMTASCAVRCFLEKSGRVDGNGQPDIDKIKEYCTTCIKNEITDSRMKSLLACLDQLKGTNFDTNDELCQDYERFFNCNSSPETPTQPEPTETSEVPQTEAPEPETSTAADVPAPGPEDTPQDEVPEPENPEPEDTPQDEVPEPESSTVSDTNQPEEEQEANDDSPSEK